MTAERGQVGVFLRFLLVNALNTGLYWGLYLLFLQVMPYFWANAVALVLAVLVAYVANARYAFGVATSRSSLMRYLVANGTTIVLRMLVVWVLVAPGLLPEELAPPAAVAITMPVAFLLTRWAMKVTPPGRGPVAAPVETPSRGSRAAAPL
ncbi:Putative flippase GtrA (transmembrane translocase of bactoprenol-linked glucose) [Blastococcus sp. DSM 46786]|uniref:GtrA family protein n=1 Tax=Blastococcus sp. DSM 46786 TaxID=1798227 RepID=UPI0008CB1BAD|nr:GtrA family protein [Blastococcus sp. DSM 46786]SEK25052.1 Putative flippase GtrA (transmembrane translocase of bactoprenol-linked glucose) [Blastococcus sp. DSM 46786]